MDGISFLEASILYSVLLAPLLSIVLLFLWSSLNMKSTAKSQLIGIIILLAIGFIAINSPIIFIIEAVAIVLLVIWIVAYKDFFLNGQLSTILLFFALQVIYYILFFVSLGLEYSLSITLLCIIPFLSLILLYPWIFGNKKTSQGRVFIIITFIVQLIYGILIIVLSFMGLSNL